MRHAGRPRATTCVLCLALGLAAACAPKAPAFPTGAGAPFPEFASAYDQATAPCRNVKSFSASMALSGKAGRTKLRGRIDAGFAAPARMRLEGRAPFGRPVFVLTADDAHATLVLPRDERVLTNARPEQIVEALAGVPVAADTLRIAVSGCGLSLDAPSAGRTHGHGWAAVTVGNTTVYLRSAGNRWTMMGAVRDSLTVIYSDVAGGRPQTVRIRAAHQDGTADLTLRLSQVEINTTLDPRTFDAEIPASAEPLTLEELRKAGPLGGAEGTGNQ